MKTLSAFLKAPFTVEMREVDVPQPGPDEVLLKIRACGICGSDVNDAYTRSDFAPFGHEFSADVLALGSEVRDLRVGDTVIAESSSFCGKCAPCRNGHPELCRKRYIFHNPYNGFSDIIVAKAGALVPYTGITYEEAALVEPMGVALDLVNVTDIQLGDHVVVFGAGPIGIMAVRLAKLRGAGKVTVCAHAHSAARIALARQYGADDIILTDRADLRESLRAQRVDRVMVTTPPPTLVDAVSIASFGAIIGMIGFGRTREEAAVTLDTNRMHFLRMQLRFSFAAPALFFPQCVDLIRRRQLDVLPLISHRFPLTQMQQALSVCRDDKRRCVKVMMVNE